MHLQLGYKDIWFFLAAAIFKGQLLKMAATVEFGNFHHYYSLNKSSELVCAVLSLGFLWTDIKTMIIIIISEDYANYDMWHISQ